MKITYRPRGVCSRLMEIDVEDNKIVAVSVMCPASCQLDNRHR